MSKEAITWLFILLGMVIFSWVVFHFIIGGNNQRIEKILRLMNRYRWPINVALLTFTGISVFFAIKSLGGRRASRPNYARVAISESARYTAGLLPTFASFRIPEGSEYLAVANTDVGRSAKGGKPSYTFDDVKATVRSCFRKSKSLKECEDKDQLAAYLQDYTLIGTDIQPLRFLLRNGVPADLPDEDGITPSMWAAQKGHESVLRLLISSGASVNSKDNDGKSLLLYAVDGGKEQIIDILVSKGANTRDLNKSQSNLLMAGVTKGSYDLVRYILKRFKNRLVNTADENGQTALFYAIESGNQDIVSLLLKNGAKVNIYDKSDLSPLNYAIRAGKKSVVKLIADSTTNIKVRKSALFAAYQLNEPQAIIELLVRRKIDLFARDSLGRTVLMYAAYEGKTPVAKILSEVDGLVNEADQDGNTALMFALHQKNNDIATLLIKSGAELNRPDNTGRTLLMYACIDGSGNLVKTLLDAGADLHSRDKDGLDALALAFHNKRFDIVELLLRDYKANPNNVDKAGRSLLMYAAANKNLSQVNILLSFKARTDLLDNANNSALAYAYDAGRYDIVTKIIEYSGNVPVANESQKDFLRRVIQDSMRKGY